MIACKYGHLTLVRALVEWQANICAKTKVIKHITWKTLGVVTKPKSIASTHAQMQSA